MMSETHEGNQYRVQDDMSQVELEDITLEWQSAGDEVREWTQFAFLSYNNVVMSESQSVKRYSRNKQDEGSRNGSIHNATKAY